MDIREESLKKHYEWQGKIEVISRTKIETREDCFQPAMPVEQMTMRLFFNKIHTADFNKEDETQTQSEISKHFCNHISNIENATSEMLIKDL